MQSYERKLTKIISKKYYLLDGSLVRITSLNKRFNRVTLYRYDVSEYEDIEYDTAPYYLKPLLKIGEVAKLLDRSVETLRRYETWGYIPKAKQYQVGQIKVRLYSERDIQELADFFAKQSSRGRPATISKINQRELISGLKRRIGDWKL